MITKTIKPIATYK